jgi:hypothetical protein
MKRGAHAQLFLRYASPFAESAQVLAEPLCDLHYSISSREEVEGRAGRQHEGSMTSQEPAANEIANRPLDGIVFLEVVGMRVERLGYLWDRLEQ